MVILSIRYEVKRLFYRISYQNTGKLINFERGALDVRLLGTLKDVLNNASLSLTDKTSEVPTSEF